jgi:hypothetical protein
VALILRRGPSAWYHLILWDTARDTFEHGAWFKGRIYEERCDLSPDGDLFLYFALQGSRWGTSYKGAWTAVSRPPWLHALALWPQGHTWGGGGRFLDRRRIALFACDLRTHPDHPAVGLEVSVGADACRSELPQQEWSGRDHARQAVYTRDGKLFRRRRGREVELADFNGLRPDPQPAPAWAMKPLPALKRPKGRKRSRRTPHSR